MTDQTEQPEQQQEHFILDSITVGTSIKVKYQIFNERTRDYKRMSLTEKEDWHPDFADIVATITRKAADVATLDIDGNQIQNVRAKKLAFEGLNCIAELHVYRPLSVDPIKITTYAFNIDGETKLQITHEANQYVLHEKRRQGDLFGLGEAIVKNKNVEVSYAHDEEEMHEEMEQMSADM